jgi:putative transcriptional regulator
MSKLGQRLIKSAEEAVAIAEGRMKPARIFEPEEIDVASIRKRQNLSQAKFAERYRLSAATVRDWEQKRRTPDRIAMNYLTLVDRMPVAVAKAFEDPKSTSAERPAIKNSTKK